jgi:F-type H+-transporting ATPase subunit delta
MGSSSRQALALALEQLSATKGVSLATGEQLLAAARAIDDSAQLRAILGDPAVEAEPKATLIAQVFPGAEKTTAALLGGIVASRWSSGAELVDGIEELGIRAIAQGDGHTATIESELFTFARIVAADAQLELALGSKLADPAGKASIVQELLSKQATPGALAIVLHLVQSPRGRRIGEMLAAAGDLVAAAGSRRIATVTTAGPLSAAQQKRLAAALAAKYGSDIQLNLVTDPSVVGGARVQLGDDVIDGTIASRLADLRLQLVG